MYERKTYTTYVTVLLRSEPVTSAPVASFDFDTTEDAVDFAAILLGRLDYALIGHQNTRGVTYTHAMRDYVDIYVNVSSSTLFDEIWPYVVGPCRVAQATYGRDAHTSTVSEFPYGY